MTLQGWILLATGIVVGIPAVWIVLRTIQGPPHALPTYWCELPPSAAGQFHIVIALAAPLHDRAPREVQDLHAVSHAVAGQPVGMVLAPGTYWLYAVPARGREGMVETLDVVFAAIKAGGSSLVPVGATPVTVGTRR
ncbi:MAG: hypothetical protein H6Q90_1386 [Deltaproteobacteria bacterium]|nr:hypothetical protein [Deltaproteobacteria bacterium]